VYESECGRVGVDNVVSVVCRVVRALVLTNFVLLQNAEDIVAVAEQVVQRLRPEKTGIFPEAPNLSGYLIRPLTHGIRDGEFRFEKRHSPMASELAHNVGRCFISTGAPL
jgi:hypothetical protein